MTDTEPVYDVAILGAGVAGSALSSVLARHGVNVLLIDAGAHPRFAIGESTIPFATNNMNVLAQRYDVPELAPLSNFKDTVRQVSVMCGQKQNFGFVYHEDGEPQSTTRANQIVLPIWYRTEAHWFRQDIDSYVFDVAVKYGADHRLNTRIEDIDIDPADGVTLTSNSGERFRAKYLIDASGFRSPVSEAYGLREQPARAQTNSRSVFTHMMGVKPFDEVSEVQYGQPTPWHNGTLHHVFDGGWLWVIPFDNHDASLNPLCSVGLTITDGSSPGDHGTPEEEFGEFLRRFPVVAKQFTHARTVRPWIGTGRLQHSVSQTVGERYCLTAAAAGTIDALFSRGLANTFETVNALAWRLIGAVADDDWSRERFAGVDDIQQRTLDANDDLVYSSYVAFRHYDLWDVMLRLWDTYSFFTGATQEHTLAKFLSTGDDQLFRNHEVPGTDLAAALRELLRTARTTCQAVERGDLTASGAADQLFEYLRDERFWPDYMPHLDRSAKFFDIDADRAMQVLHWSRTEAPQRMREAFA